MQSATILLEADLTSSQVGEFAQFTAGCDEAWSEPFLAADEAAPRLYEHAAAIHTPRKELMPRLRP